jgi:TRAP transporter TAXI family solute receptor
MNSSRPRAAVASACRRLRVSPRLVLRRPSLAPASAQERPNVNRLGQLTNQNTIYIVSGNPNGTYLRAAYDMTAVLDDEKENTLRVLAVIGKGGGQNLRDVRFLKGVDLGITQSVLLNRFKRTNEIGPVDDKFVYIAKLFNEEMHLIVRAESGIASIEQLAGKTVNFSDIGSGTQLSTREIFERLKIPAKEVNMGQADAFEALRKGEIAASILIAGKPTGSTRTIRSADGFRLLPVAYAKPLQDYFYPAVLTHEDYPTLIEPGQQIDTIAVGAVLFAYNWPKGSERYRRIETFVNAFFPKLAEFQKKPRHPKWMEANLAATLPGWNRHEAAEEWLQKHRPTVQTQPASPTERAQFNDFVAARQAASAFAPEDREKLFQEFLKWKTARERR